jgi:uncharacterized membrane protein YqjE
VDTRIHANAEKSEIEENKQIPETFSHILIYRTFLKFILFSRVSLFVAFPYILVPTNRFASKEQYVGA